MSAEHLVVLQLLGVCIVLSSMQGTFKGVRSFGTQVNRLQKRKCN